MPGARSLDEVLSRWRGEINRDSWQAQGLRVWLTPLAFPSSKVLYDHSGYGRHLALNNGPVLGNDASGRYVSFDGSDDYGIGTENVPMTNAGLTIAVRMYLVSASVLIFKAGNTGNSGIWDWGLYPGGADSFYLIRNGGNQSPGTSIPTNTWSNYVATCDDTEYRDYVNGRLGSTQGGIGSGTTANTSGRAVRLDADFGAAQARVQDVRVYDRKFSGAEAFGLYDPRTRFDLCWIRRRSAAKALSAASYSFPVVRGVSRRVLARQGVLG